MEGAKKQIEFGWAMVVFRLCVRISLDTVVTTTDFDFCIFAAKTLRQGPATLVPALLKRWFNHRLFCITWLLD
jgi:hypothetical protein